jgi:hypothetical protein
VIGFILGIGMAISYIGLAWNGFETQFQFAPALASGGILLAIGVFLFPKTVGIALTPTSMLTPIAFVIAWVRLGISDAAIVLLIGVGAIVGALIIGMLRPDATGRF